MPGMGARGAVEVQHACDEIADGNAQMAPEAALQAGIILGAAEKVAHQLAEHGVAPDELHHARGDRASKERAAIEAPHDARGKFQLAGKCSAHRAALLSLHFPRSEEQMYELKSLA